MKKICVIESSFRANSNSSQLAKAFAMGAQESGNEVITLSLKEIQPHYCLGCLACQKINKCVQKDGMNEICDLIATCDTLVFATPVYYYSICGQLKTFLDRLNPLYGKDNKFKEVYLLGTMADEYEEAFSGTITAIEGWVDCFDGVRLVESLCACGVEDAGTTPQLLLDKAYALGKNA